MNLPWKYISLSLLMGLLIGAPAGMAYSRHQRRVWMKNAPEKLLKRIDRDVHLTETQRSQIAILLKADREKITAFHDQIRQATEKDIRAQLTADQQARFDALLARLAEIRRKREGR